MATIPDESDEDEGVSSTELSELWSSHIQAFLDDASSVQKSATRIVAALAASPYPKTAMYYLWGAFFEAASAAASDPPSHHHLSLLALLRALESQPPTFIPQYPGGQRPERVGYEDIDGWLDWATLPGYHAQWRDTHDSLEAHGDFNGMRENGKLVQGSVAPEPIGAEYLRFCAFSAAEIATLPDNTASFSVIWVFFACQDALESARPTADADSARRRDYQFSEDEVRALSMRVATTWLRDGGRALFETNNQEIGQHWARALAAKTDYWPRTDGLTRDRWRMWAKRLRTLQTSTEEVFDEETIAALKEAVGIVEGLLEGAGES